MRGGEGGLLKATMMASPAEVGRMAPTKYQELLRPRARLTGCVAKSITNQGDR